MLAPGNEDQKKIQVLTHDLFRADAVLGFEVAFLLLHPAANSLLGLPVGEGGVAAFSGLTYPLRDASSFRDLSEVSGSYRVQVAETSARAMARFVPDFMGIFGVDNSELPCLCLVVRGIDESVVLSLGSAWTPDQLIELLAKIRRIVDKAPDYRSEITSIGLLEPKPIASLEEVVREIEAKERKIAKLFDQILYRHSGNDNDINMVTAFVAEGCKGEDQLAHIFSRFSFKDTKRFAQDGQVQRVEGMVSRLEDLRAEMVPEQKDQRYVLSVADRARQWLENRDRLFEQLQVLRTSRRVSTSKNNEKLLGNLKTVMDLTKTTGDVAEKLVPAIKWIMKLWI